MAKNNLERLLDRLESSLKERRDYRNTVNTYEHQYTVDFTSLWKELYTQVSGLNVKDPSRVLLFIGKDESLVRSLKSHLAVYCSTLFTKFKEYNPVGTTNSFIVNIPSEGKTDIFKSVITARRKRPLKKLQTDVYNSIKKSDWFNSLLETSNNRGHVERTLETRVLGKAFATKKRNKAGEIIYGRTSGLFELGHAVGSSVIEKWLGNELQELDNSLEELPGKAYIENRLLGRLKGLVAGTRNNRKIVLLYDQGSLSNRSQSTIENKLVPILSTTITKALEARGPDYWANFKACNSSLENIELDIIDSALRVGGKRSKKTIKNKLPKKLPEPNYSPITKDIKGTVKRTRGQDTLKRTKPVKELTLPKSGAGVSQQNWSSLLPLINVKLTPRVIANMRFPALVNRTGTFASSASVVGVEQTREGFPSFVYDYERNPYNVFDRTLGRAPWNTPERDPSALVDKSLREIVREMAIGRFYTRRA